MKRARVQAHRMNLVALAVTFLLAAFTAAAIEIEGAEDLRHFMIEHARNLAEREETNTRFHGLRKAR